MQRTSQNKQPSNALDWKDLSSRSVSSVANEYKDTGPTALPQPELKQIRIGSTELNYAELGNGAPVVFIHGALSDYRIWTAQLFSLAEQYHVVSYSRRYHQPTIATDVTNYTYRRHVDDLKELIDRLQLAPAHLIGHSYGGALATILAQEQPRMIRSLVLAEPTLFSMLTRPNDKVSLRFHRIALEVLQKLAENGEDNLAVQEYINIVLGREVFNELPADVSEIIMQNAHTLAPMLRSYFDPLAFGPESACAIRAPALIVTGESSPKLFRSISRELNNCLSNSRLSVLPDASHGLHLENPVGFAGTVLDFLAQTPS